MTHDRRIVTPSQPDLARSRFAAVLLVMTLSAAPDGTVHGQASPNPGDRTSVAAHYNGNYLPNLSLALDWDGNLATCDAGTEDAAYLQATFENLNFFRAMAGLGPIANDPALNPGARAAALIMSANGTLTHSPSPSMDCYTQEGATAAGRANLALGANGPRAIQLYMQDRNVPSLGHRRWLLSPIMANFGSGDTGTGGASANALVVLSGETVARPVSPEPVIAAWPPPGYAPYGLVFDSWSFSIQNAPNTDFSQAIVTMTENGSPVDLQSREGPRGYGDNTLIWEPEQLGLGPGQSDRTFEVCVTGIQPAVDCYEVTVFDPETDGDVLFRDGFESP